MYGTTNIKFLGLVFNVVTLHLLCTSLGAAVVQKLLSDFYIFLQKTVYKFVSLFLNICTLTLIHHILTTKPKTNKLHLCLKLSFWYIFINYFGRSTCTVELIAFSLFKLSIFGEEYKFWSSSLCRFHQCLLPVAQPKYVSLEPVLTQLLYMLFLGSERRS
jgi:hypothetical protein